MSEPTTFEFAVIRYRPLGSSGAYTTLCGIQTSGLNRTVQSDDRFIGDCAKPGKIPARRVRVTGRQWDVSGSGLADVDIALSTFDDLLGVRADYQYILMDIANPATEEGTEIGTYAGTGVLTSANLSNTERSDTTVEIAIASHGDWAYTPAA